MRFHEQMDKAVAIWNDTFLGKLLPTDPKLAFIVSIVLLGGLIWLFYRIFNNPRSNETE